MDTATFDTVHLQLLKDFADAGLEGTTIAKVEAKHKPRPVMQKIEELYKGRLIEKTDEEEMGRYSLTPRGQQVLDQAAKGKLKPKAPEAADDSRVKKSKSSEQDQEPKADPKTGGKDKTPQSAGKSKD
jgi:hypothetical protein